MLRLAYILAIAMLLGLTGCATLHGIPDADSDFKPVKPHPCERKVIVYPDRVLHCMTEEEFQRWVKRNMPGGGGW